ncbi:MAG TPA: hypothetical protein VLM38_12340 [Blastocatellia bacterium]|nr:hypothetical protein [Blastocatellia bacterium]
MNRVKKITCLFLLLITPLSATATQSKEKSTATETVKSIAGDKRDPGLARQKIVSLLYEVLEAQKAFPDQSLRVVIQAHIADMLWTIDEPRARHLFQDALVESGRLAESTYAQPLNASGAVLAARAQVIRLLMTHDLNWAAKEIERIADLADPDPKSRTSRPYLERVGLQMQLVFQIVQKEPQRATQLMKPLVENGDINYVMMVLGLIRSKDGAAAEELFVQTLARARQAQPRFDGIYRLASYVFPGFGEGVLRFSPEAAKRDPFAPGPTNPAVVEQFLEFAYDVATRRLDASLADAAGARLDAGSSYDFAVPKLLCGYFDRFMPDRAPAFRARFAEVSRRVPPDQRAYLVMTEPGTIQELQSRADAASEARLKDLLYRRAIAQATTSGDFERASEIIAKLSSEAGRYAAKTTLRRTIDDKRGDEARDALNKQDLDKAEALTAEISNWYSQPFLVPNLIGQLSNKDKVRAARILDEYERRAVGIEDGIERSVVLMELAGSAANLDSARGFQEMKNAIAEFNRAGFVPELERYRENDLSGSRTNIGLGGLLSNWQLSWLGRTDFDQAVALTRQFHMNEASAVMQLVVCRAALSMIPPASKARSVPIRVINLARSM